MTTQSQEEPEVQEEQLDEVAQAIQDLEQQNGDLTLDLQRVRADFENYRKRVEGEKDFARSVGAQKATRNILPVLDTITMAISQTPADIADHDWVKGISGVQKQLEKAMADMNLARIEAAEGVAFNPELHQAVQFDEDAEGEEEVIKVELQPGYQLDGTVLRPAMVHVTRG